MVSLIAIAGIIELTKEIISYAASLNWWQITGFGILIILLVVGGIFFFPQIKDGYKKGYDAVNPKSEKD